MPLLLEGEEEQVQQLYEQLTQFTGVVTASVLLHVSLLEPRVGRLLLVNEFKLAFKLSKGAMESILFKKELKTMVK